LSIVGIWNQQWSRAEWREFGNTHLAVAYHSAVAGRLLLNILILRVFIIRNRSVRPLYSAQIFVNFTSLNNHTNKIGD